MRHWFIRCILILLCLIALPFNSPAPLIYRADEGWIYEPVGGGKWRRTRAKDQLEVAQAAFDKKDYSLALKASRRTVSTWPLSDYAPKAQYLIGRAYEEKHQDEKAFKQYQKLIEKYPKSESYAEVLQRQFTIANRFLAGQWFKLWGYVPFFPNMDKTAEMYEKIIKNGAYSEVGPKAQMNIGAAREKKSDYPAAVRAYAVAADRYHDQKTVAADAVYKQGLAYQRQAKKAEYDQSVAGQAITTFNDFITMFPEDPRVTEAQKQISSLKVEQARGSFMVAKFYEKKKRWDGALVYYSEVLLKDPTSKFAEEAKQRIETIKQRTAKAAPPK
ncbi:MAG: outer membrane protein assembly factor BamD [Verrucomicrobia bacterium]|nr:outer membrane protein assembly factor BamD [Verrucomicrobiota bacterium]